MSEHAGENTGAVLTPEQRTTFRSAGVWMAILGGIELAAGLLAGIAWVLVLVGGVPLRDAMGPRPTDWIVNALLTVVTVGIGVLTLLTARSFRRAARRPDAGLAAVTEAVADLRELYERQVWATGVLLGLAIAGALAAR
jgi:hypothetical protein